MLHIITFATTDLNRSVARLSSQVASLNLDTTFTVYNEKSLTSNKPLEKIIQQHQRGYGLWAWKPYIISEYLKKIPAESNILYIDVGCEINKLGEPKLLDYLNLLKSSSGILPFRATPPPLEIRYDNFEYDDLLEYKWSKSQLFKYFNADSIEGAITTPQFGAGIIFLRKNTFTVDFIEEWRDIMENNVELYDDVSFTRDQIPSFIQSRHDQSVFSLLCKKHHISLFVSAYEYFHPYRNSFWKDLPIGDWKRLVNYPIHAKRNKNYGLLKNLLLLNYPLLKVTIKAIGRYLRRSL